MSIDGKLGDGKGTGKIAHLHQQNGDVGLIVFSEDLHRKQFKFSSFLNDVLGSELAVDAGFTGTPSGVHNGGDTVLWTASAIAGTWDFASTTNPDTGSACIDATATTDGSEVLFTSPASIDMSNFTALTGRIRLETWGSGDKHVLVRFRLGGTLISNIVHIDEFIDTGKLNEYQSFSISKSVLGIESAIIDEIVIETTKNSGANPGYRLDNLQIEETGGSIEFFVEAPKDTKFLVDTLAFTFIDAFDSTLINSSMPNLSYDQILAEPLLSLGILVQRIVNNETLISLSGRSLGEFVKSGGVISNLFSDGTNTSMTIRLDFSTPIILDSRDEDVLKVIVQDDLSGLISFTVAAIGNTQAIL